MGFRIYGINLLILFMIRYWLSLLLLSRKFMERESGISFLMTLGTAFEITYFNLMNRDSSFSLDVCFRDLLHEDTSFFSTVLHNF